MKNDLGDKWIYYLFKNHEFNLKKLVKKIFATYKFGCE